MNRKDSAQSRTAKRPGQFPVPPSGEESEPKNDPTTWSPAQEDISNKEVKNPDLSEADRS
jgi:hypothetical protein